jgi:NADH-quinone oxidoreductase subunit E
MSVRRLAEPAVQPASFAFSSANAAQAEQWIAKYPKGREQSAVIPLLMLAQEQEGWVTKAAIEHVSGMLDMPLIRVLEVATFYTQFQLKPIARVRIQVCGTTPCMPRLGSPDGCCPAEDPPRTVPHQRFGTCPGKKSNPAPA